MINVAIKDISVQHQSHTLHSFDSWASTIYTGTQIEMVIEIFLDPISSKVQVSNNFVEHLKVAIESAINSVFRVEGENVTTTKKTLRTLFLKEEKIEEIL